MNIVTEEYGTGRVESMYMLGSVYKLGQFAK